MPTTRRTRGAVLTQARDDPMPRKPRSRGTSVASSSRSNDEHSIRVGLPAPSAIVSRLEAHNEELVTEVQHLRQELEKQTPKRRTLRDKRLAEQLAEYHAQHPIENEQEKEVPASKEATPASPQASQEVDEDATPRQLVQTPDTRTTKVPLQSSTPEAPASVPRWRQLLSSLGGFSPFPSRRSATPKGDAPNKPVNKEPQLGELPQNRKRPATDAESETPTKRPRTPEPVTDAPQPSLPQPQPVVEQSRPPTSNSTTQTPTRMPKKTSVPQTENPQRTAQEPMFAVPDTTPRRRTIRDVRAAKSKTPLPESGLRRWETPVNPREPNADKRLARMREIEKLKKAQEEMKVQLAKLTAEQEADGIDTRRRKRVKVDELVYIPHNMPGDVEGTFRVPDWDSDEEMEVDEAVPIRQNMFSLNAEKQVQPPSQAKPAAAQPSQALPPKSLFAPSTQAEPPKTVSFAQAEPAKLVPAPANMFKAVPAAQPPKAAPIQPTAAAQQPKTNIFQSALSKQQPAKADSSPSKKTFDWPSVGLKQDDSNWSQADKVAAGRKFARGFESWLSPAVTV